MNPSSDLRRRTSAAKTAQKRQGNPNNQINETKIGYLVLEWASKILRKRTRWSRINLDLFDSTSLVIIIVICSFLAVAVLISEGTFSLQSSTRGFGSTANGFRRVRKEQNMQQSQNQVKYVTQFDRKNQNGKLLPKQRVVLLPGPHKTGTTSIQLNLLKWTEEGRKGTANIVGNHWSWPVIMQNRPVYDIGLLVRDLMTTAAVGRDMDPKKRTSPLKRQFYQELRQQWKNGRSIVFGHEWMDWILREEGGVGSNELLAQILSLMPWETLDNKLPALHGSISENLIVSVTYRYPRIDHLISIWHEIGREHQTLSKFISTLSKDDDVIRCFLNPLGLAHAFVKRDVPTVVIDTSGLKQTSHAQNKSLDITEVIACEVMEIGVPCHHQQDTNDGGRVLIDLNERPQVYNKGKKPGKIDLNEDQLSRINDILVEFDCKYYNHLSSSSTLKILHQHHLFRNCADREFYLHPNKGSSVFNQEDLVRNIVDVATEQDKGEKENK